MQWFADVMARTGMLRVANITARAAVLAFVGAITFTSRWPAHTPHLSAQLTLQVVAFVIAAVMMATWAVAGFVPWLGSWCVPWILGIIALVSGAAATTKTGGNFLDLAVVVAITAGNANSLAVGWIVAGLGTLGFESIALPGGTSIWAVIACPCVLLVALLLGRLRREYRIKAEQSAALLAKADQLREEQATVAALGERARIAREIHDVLAHSLGALALNIQAARAVLTDQHDEARAVEILDQAQRMAADGLSETRRAVHALRGETLPLPEGLAELSAAHQRRHGARVTFEVTGAPRPLPPDAGLAITRTAQCRCAQLPHQGRRPGRDRPGAAQRRHRPGRARPGGSGHAARRRGGAGEGTAAGPARRADAAGGRDPLPDRPGQNQPRHRGRTLPERAHGQEPHQPHLRQDRFGGPPGGDPLRPRPRPHLAAPEMPSWPRFNAAADAISRFSHPG